MIQNQIYHLRLVQSSIRDKIRYSIRRHLAVTSLYLTAPATCLHVCLGTTAVFLLGAFHPFCLFNLWRPWDANKTMCEFAHQACSISLILPWACGCMLIALLCACHSSTNNVNSKQAAVEIMGKKTLFTRRLIAYSTYSMVTWFRYTMQTAYTLIFTCSKCSWFTITSFIPSSLLDKLTRAFLNGLISYARLQVDV